MLGSSAWYETDQANTKTLITPENYVLHAFDFNRVITRYGAWCLFLRRLPKHEDLILYNDYSAIIERQWILNQVKKQGHPHLIFSDTLIREPYAQFSALDNLLGNCVVMKQLRNSDSLSCPGKNFSKHSMYVKISDEFLVKSVIQFD